MAKLLQRLPFLLLLALASPDRPTGLPACPFCNQDGKTLTNEVKDATMVLYGDLTNAESAKDTTEIVSIRYQEAGEGRVALGDGKKVTLRGYHPPDAKGEYR